MSSEIFCFGGRSSGLTSGAASAVVALSSTSTSLAGGRISASLEAAADTNASYTCWRGVLARCRRRVEKDQRQECSVKNTVRFRPRDRACAYITGAKNIAPDLELRNKGPNAGGILSSIFRTIVDPCAWQEPDGLRGESFDF